LFCRVPRGFKQLLSEGEPVNFFNPEPFPSRSLFPAVKLPLARRHSSPAAAASRALSEVEGGSETESKNEGPGPNKQHHLQVIIGINDPSSRACRGISSVVFDRGRTNPSTNSG
jgi:hypothetical protein